MFGGHYDLVHRASSECIGQIIANTFYSLAGPGAGGFDGKVYGDKHELRLMLRQNNEVWLINGLALTTPSGELYNLVQTAQVICGKIYPANCNADTYRALVDCAQVALEEHYVECYRKPDLC
ncbi:hypothetical protein [Pseudomonas sp. Q1]|uniref:hypothetical protein n=1 Tax=Pseudomonas sp. Q1 TaxID=2202823 RepID=UPI002114D807|nr:hypothetical protein [Pseudomonas sp. Q1]